MTTYFTLDAQAVAALETLYPGIKLFYHHDPREGMHRLEVKLAKVTIVRSSNRDFDGAIEELWIRALDNSDLTSRYLSQLNTELDNFNFPTL